MTVPLLQLVLVDEKDFELEPGITLRVWTEWEKCLYQHRNHRYYPLDDPFGPLRSQCYLEIVTNSHSIFKHGHNRKALEELIDSALARVKWAIMQVTTPAQLILELIATTEIQQELFGFLPIRRQGIGVQYKRDNSAMLDTNACQSAAKLLAMLKCALEKFPDIIDVMWLFDRATLAESPRNILLESVIGLERLLVTGSGESSRRFRTYGAALIANGDFTETSKKLNEIYSLRSKAAHGSTEHPKQFEELSIAAVKYLADAIKNVVRLVVASKINSNRKENINKAIEKYITSIMCEAIQKDLADANIY